MKDSLPYMDMNYAHLHLESRRIIINMNGRTVEDLKQLIKFLHSTDNMKPYWRFTNSSNFIITEFEKLLKEQNVVEIFTPFLVLSRRSITPLGCISLYCFRSTDPLLKDMGGTVMTLEQFYGAWEEGPKE